MAVPFRRLRTTKQKLKVIWIYTYFTTNYKSVSATGTFWQLNQIECNLVNYLYLQLALSLSYLTYRHTDKVICRAHSRLKLLPSLLSDAWCSLAAWLPPVRYWPDHHRRLREVPRTRPQEVRRRAAHLLGQPQVEGWIERWFYRLGKKLWMYISIFW